MSPPTQCVQGGPCLQRLYFPFFPIICCLPFQSKPSHPQYHPTEFRGCRKIPWTFSKQLIPYAISSSLCPALHLLDHAAVHNKTPAFFVCSCVPCRLSHFKFRALACHTDTWPSPTNPCQSTWKSLQWQAAVVLSSKGPWKGFSWSSSIHGVPEEREPISKGK